MLPAKSFHKIRILCCLFPDTMIDMRHGKEKGHRLLYARSIQKRQTESAPPEIPAITRSPS